MIRTRRPPGADSYTSRSLCEASDATKELRSYDHCDVASDDGRCSSLLQPPACTPLRTSFLGASIGSALVFLAQKILDRHTHVLRLLHGCFRPTARAHKGFSSFHRLVCIDETKEKRERERDTGRDMVNIELFLLSFVTLCR